jgi:ribosomal protein L11
VLLRIIYITAAAADSEFGPAVAAIGHAPTEFGGRTKTRNIPKEGAKVDVDLMVHHQQHEHHLPQPSSKSKMSSNARTRMTYTELLMDTEPILPPLPSSDPTATLAVPVEIHPKSKAQAAAAVLPPSTSGGTADYPKFTRNTPALPPPP